MEYLTIDEFLKVLYNRHEWMWGIFGLIIHDTITYDRIQVYDKYELKKYIGYCCSFVGRNTQYTILG